MPLNAINEFRCTIKGKQDEEDINVEFFRYDATRDVYLFARGNLPLIDRHFGHCTIEDHRAAVPMAEDVCKLLKFSGKLRPGQLAVATQAIAAGGYGQIEAPPRFGKTITLVHMACELKLKTLFLSHQIDLSKQMLGSFYNFTNLIDVEYELGRPVVGIVDKWEDLDKFDIAIMTYQKFVTGTDAELMLEAYKNHFGAVFVDECFDGRTPVLLADGTFKEIRKIAMEVESGEDVKIKSYNPDTKTWEPKRVLRAFKSRATEDWFRVELGKQSKVFCTGSHNWFLDGYVKKQSSDLKIGDVVITHPVDGSFAKPRKLGDWQKQLLLGGFFGDFGFMKTTNRARVRIVHGVKQKEYFDYKCRILKSIIKEEPKFNIIGFSKLGTWSTSTLSSVEIKWMMMSWEKDPENFIEQLDDRAWAFLFMDNGSHTGWGARLHINRSPLDKAALLSLAFNKRYSATTYIADYKGSTLVVNTVDYGNFCKRVGKYFHPSLRYKLQVPSEHFIEGVDDAQNYAVEEVTKISRWPVCKKSSPFRYDLEVEDNHNYLVGSGYLVSNCHRASAPRYSAVVGAFNPRYRLGVTGTVERKDQMHLINQYIIGPVVATGLSDQVPCQAHIVHTNIKIPIRGQNNKMFFVQALSYLATNEARNDMLTQYIYQYAAVGHFIMAISDRTSQIKTITAQLKKLGIKAEEYHSSAFKNKTAREDCLNRIRSGSTQVIVAMRSMTLGLDIPRLTALFNLLPSSNQPNYYQETSRVRTNFPGKEMAHVIDFVDDHYIMEACAKSRMKVYHKHSMEVV